MTFLQQHSHARYKRGKDDFRTNASLCDSVHSFVIFAPLAVGLEAARRQMRLHDHRWSLKRCGVCNFSSKKTADLAGTNDFVANLVDRDFLIGVTKTGQLEPQRSAFLQQRPV